MVDSNGQGSSQHSSNADPLVAGSNGAKSADCELCESTWAPFSVVFGLVLPVRIIDSKPSSQNRD